MSIRKNEITALIGPSGCGKTTVLRCLNRTNDLIQGAKVHGQVLYHDIDLYGPKVEPVEVRRRIGMVFQKPNPFPKSIYDNVAFGPRVGGYQGQPGRARGAVAPPGRALGRGQATTSRPPPWRSPAASSSACASPAASPWSPTSSSWTSPARRSTRSPRSGSKSSWTSSVSEYTIVIVTHNMQQAARVSDRTGFFTVAEGQDEKDHRIGILVEYDLTPTVFTNPSDPRTEAYVTGRFG